MKVIMFLIPSLSLVVPGSGVERMGNDRQHNLHHPVDESYLEPKGDESHCLPVKHIRGFIILEYMLMKHST